MTPREWGSSRRSVMATLPVHVLALGKLRFEGIVGDVAAEVFKLFVRTHEVIEAVLLPDPVAR